VIWHIFRRNSPHVINRTPSLSRLLNHPPLQQIIHRLFCFFRPTLIIKSPFAQKHNQRHPANIIPHSP